MVDFGGSTPPVAPALTGAGIDLIRLATETSDARGAEKLAKRRLEWARKNRDQGVVPESEVVTLEVSLETASSKVLLLRAIAEAAADATKSEFARHRELFEKGLATQAESVQAEARLRILMLILDEGSSGGR